MIMMIVMIAMVERTTNPPTAEPMMSTRSLSSSGSVCVCVGGGGGG